MIEDIGHGVTLETVANEGTITIIAKAAICPAAARLAAEAIMRANIRPGRFSTMLGSLPIKNIGGNNTVKLPRKLVACKMPVVWLGWTHSGYWPDFQGLN